MDTSEMRQMTPKKLQEALAKAKRSLAVKRFHVKTTQNQNTAELKAERKGIARMKTVLNEKKS